MKKIFSKLILMLFLITLVLPGFAQAVPADVEETLTRMIEDAVYVPTETDLEEERYIPEMAVILTDWTTGETLFEYNADEMRYPASTTKIMTALLTCEAIERGEIGLSDTVAMTQSAIDPLPWDASSVYYPIEADEELSVEEYLYCMMLESDCRSCNILAEYVSGSIEAFAKEMTSRAEVLGCTDTNFVTPSGYHDDNHYTTAHDLSLIASEAMRHPLFREIVASHTYTVSETNMRGERHLYSSNRLYGAMDVSGEGYYEGYGWAYLFDYTYEYACGIKTGTTSMAGSCLASFAEKTDKDQHLVCIVLGVTNREAEGDEMPDLMQYVLTRELLDAGFAELDRQEEELQRLSESIDLEPSPEDETEKTDLSAANDENISGENEKTGWIKPVIYVIIAIAVLLFIRILMRKRRHRRK